MGLDSDDEALDTFSRNHPSAEALHRLIEKTSGAELIKAAGVSGIDVLIGGPSCQGYSTIGKRNTADPRNFLFSHYLRIVSEIRPHYVLFENVRGMLLSGHARIFNNLISGLHKLGYGTQHAVLNAADYGVPQRRERLFIMGALRSMPTLPEPSHQDPRCRQCSRPDGSKRVRAKDRGRSLRLLPCVRCNGTGSEPIGANDLSPWISIWDANGDLPDLGSDGGTDDFVKYTSDPFSSYQRYLRERSHGYTLHRAKPISRYALSIVRQIPEGLGVRAIPEHLPSRAIPNNAANSRRVLAPGLHNTVSSTF